jgi:hypothetical protein
MLKLMPMFVQPLKWNSLIMIIDTINLLILIEDIVNLIRNQVIVKKMEILVLHHVVQKK